MKLIASLTLLGSDNNSNLSNYTSLDKSKLDSIVATTGITKLSKFVNLSFTEAATYLIDHSLSNSQPPPTHLLTCTQTPDRLMPSPSLDILNNRHDFCDIGYTDLRTGCTGFVDCAMIASCIISQQSSSVVYCITGDISSRIVDPSDHATTLVFGDAINLSIFANSSSKDNNIVPHGFASVVDRQFKDAIYMNSEYLIMDGLRVLTFVMHSVFPALKKYIFRIQESQELSNYSLIFHQANKFIVDLLNKKITKEFSGLLVHPFCLENIGNSSSSTIPLAISQCSNAIAKNVIICGFGVGMATHIGVIEVEQLYNHLANEDSMI